MCVPMLFFTFVVRGFLPNTRELQCICGQQRGNIASVGYIVPGQGSVGGRCLPSVYS